MLTLHNIWHSLRILLAILLIAVSLWALLLPPLFPVSSRAVVNARVATLDSPGDGVLTRTLNQEKDLVQNQQTLFVLAKNQVSIRNKIDKLLLNQSNTENQLLATQWTIKNLQLNLDKLGQNLKQQLLNHQDELNNILAQKQALAALNQQKYQAKRSKEKELYNLYKEGIITQAVFDKASGERLDAERQQLSNEADISSTELELSLLSNKLSKELSTGEVAKSADMTDAAKEIRKYTQQKRVLENKLSTIKLDIQAQNTRFKSNAAIEISTPVTGLIWRQNVIAGQAVSTGQALAEVADGTTLFIEAYLGRHFLDSLSIGDRAIVYLISDQQFYEGTVERIETEDTDESSGVAISTAPPNPYMLKLIISIKNEQLPIAKLGELARIMVGNENPSLLERGMIRLSFLLRSNQ